MKKIISIVFFSALGGAITLGAYKLFFEEKPIPIVQKAPESSNIVHTSYSDSKSEAIEETDFTVAAKKTVHSVVHVKNTSITTVRDPFAQLLYGSEYGSRKFSQVGTGSGVIISSDGYIVTNNHVIKNASEIEVTLNDKKMYKATLVGADSSSDIALLKVEASGLPYITFANSDNIKIGEWVLAVGNPYNLMSTVTAGIISAKGRNLEGTNNIESFIQTDAAVNRGNSGGALVNTRGELIGINTAISSRNGSFVGYSFAVPSNIARKIVEDLMEYGNVQNAILGVQGGELNQKVAEKLGINDTEGFYISEVTENSGAEKAGLKEKDIIIGIGDTKVSTFSDLSGVLKSKRPNDVVNIHFIRDGVQKMVNVVLTKNEIRRMSSLGLMLQNVDKNQLKKLGISSGVRITDISNRELIFYGVQKGYIITKINGVAVKDVDDVIEKMNQRNQNQAFKVEMINLKGKKERYIFR